jgi:hypothetical protein
MGAGLLKKAGASGLTKFVMIILIDLVTLLMPLMLNFFV